jgi:hypothetical protein
MGQEKACSKSASSKKEGNRRRQAAGRGAAGEGRQQGGGQQEKACSKKVAIALFCTKHECERADSHLVFCNVLHLLKHLALSVSSCTCLPVVLISATIRNRCMQPYSSLHTSVLLDARHKS